jgi:hypothetical protein
MSGVRNPGLTLLAIVRYNCRGSHCIQAEAADSLVNLTQNDPTVGLSHVRF